jgi:adenylate kinase
MLIRNNKKLKEEIKELKELSEVLALENKGLKEELSWSYDRKTIINAFDTLILLNFDSIGEIFKNDQVKKVEIQSIMSTGEVDECFVSMSYSVKMFGFNEVGHKIEYMALLVHEAGDGMFYSKVANDRRLNYYELTCHFADYIEKEILRGCRISGYTVSISRIEEKIEDLLHYQIPMERKEKMNIILVGAPGAGKGTLSAFLKKEYNLPYLSTGDIFRAEIKRETELGQLARKLIDNGDFIPDDITLQVVKNALSELKNGYILDGFPRNLSQVEAFDEMLKIEGMHIDKVLHIYLNDEMVRNRLAYRQVCPSCQTIYHKKDLPPKTLNICDHCQTTLVVREDDKPELVNHRLEIYHDNTEPIIDHYESQGILETIFANCSIQELYKQAEFAIKTKIRKDE